MRETDSLSWQPALPQNYGSGSGTKDKVMGKATHSSMPKYKMCHNLIGVKAKKAKFFIHFPAF